jgi:prolyl oligopeptidase
VINRHWLLTTGLILTTAATAQTLPPPLPPKPVTETLYGVTVTDPYRYFEDEKNQAVIDWMKAQGRYTRGVMDSIPARAEMLQKVQAFTGSLDAVKTIQDAGGRRFFQERAPGSDNFDLLVRYPDGTIRKLIDVAAIRAAHGGAPFAINYFVASWDGAKVAVGISEGGSEDASLFVYDATTGAQIAGPLLHAQYGIVAWTPDNAHVFVNLLNSLKPGESAINKYKNSKVYFWDLKSAPVAVLGNGVGTAIAFTPEETPGIATTPDSARVMAFNVNGVQPELEMWSAALDDAERPDTPWQKVIARSDGVTSATYAHDRLFLLSHQDAPTFKVLALDAGQPLSTAQTVVPASPTRLIESISAASDGVYVMTRSGVYSQLLEVPLAGGAPTPIALPEKGSIEELATDPLRPGAVMVFANWIVPPSVLAYDPKTSHFTDLKMGTKPAGYDGSLYKVEDLQAKAKDGVMVPLSYVTAKDATYPRPLLLWAYGSYGISQFPGFSSRFVPMIQNGIDFAVCHVRGGGELGEAWRLGGKDANKPNTWRDLIACAEDLIARGATAKDKLFIAGGSAGGITMGRAMEERPDLFAGVFDMVPAANATRQEFSPNGPGNTPEFGTVANETGFRNLYAMDSLLHVEPGKQYPPIMITTGLNDPRVASWEPAKLAATLQVSGDKNPVLLRVDEQAGHGMGSTRSQNDELAADMISFIKWQVGAKGWQPVPTAAK